MPDHYTYPGTEVLVNLRGYTQPGLWKAAERRLVNTHLAELMLRPIDGDFDLAHLQAIHARLVEGFYSWGGVLRDTDTGPGGTDIAHCLPQFIPTEADRVFTALADADRLRGRDRARFAKGLAWVWGETTAIHPFRDVNTRSQFVFFTQLATEAGWMIDWTRIDPHVFAHARTLAISRDEEGLEALLYPALNPTGQIDRDNLRDQIQAMADEFTRPRQERTRNVLDEELTRVVQRRQAFLDDPSPFADRHDPGTNPPARGL